MSPRMTPANRGKAFGLQAAGLSLRKAVGGDQVCHQRAQVEGGQVGEGQGRYGGRGEVWEEGVVFTEAGKVVKKESRGDC